MKKKKLLSWKRILLWSLTILLILGVSGLFAANYAVDKVIESMADSLDDEVTSKVHSTGKSQEDSTIQSTTGNEQPEGVSQETAKPVGEQVSAEQAKDKAKFEKKESDKVGVYAPEVSTDKAKAIKEEVTISEKASVTSILMGSLSLSDIKLFQEMANGGMTVDEKRAARKVLLDELSPEEYNTLAGIAKKYGVSRGKTYDEAEKEEAEAEK